MNLPVKFSFRAIGVTTDRTAVLSDDGQSYRTVDARLGDQVVVVSLEYAERAVKNRNWTIIQDVIPNTVVFRSRFKQWPVYTAEVDPNDDSMYSVHYDDKNGQPVDVPISREALNVNFLEKHYVVI